MKVTDLPTLNLILAECGCCPTPACDENSILCESLSHTSHGADDSHTDAHDAWEERGNLHSTWQVDHFVWANNHAAFPADHAAWVACQGTGDGGCGAEPVDPVEPVEPPAAGPEPLPPANYGDVQHGCYAPFAEPPGDPALEVGTLYRTLDEDLSGKNIVTGSYYLYDPEFNTETLGVTTFDAAGVPTTTGSGNLYTDPDTCGPLAYDGGNGVDFASLPGLAYGPAVFTCTANERKIKVIDTASQGSIPLALAGCPGPWPGEVQESWDLTRTDTEVYTVDSGITKPNLIARAVSNILAAWPILQTGFLCEAGVTAIWPTARDLYVDRNLTATPPQPGHWADCSGPWALPRPAQPQATATRIRYQVGVPLLYMGHRLWLIAKAEWDACEVDTPGGCGTAPVEPRKYHYFAIQWDMMFFPKAWEAWRMLFDAWETAVAIHDQWIIEHAAWVTAGSDPDTEPVEPAVPADPSANQPSARPSYIHENLFWEFTGGETLATQYSPWHEVAAPATEGVIRMVNKQMKCWRSVRTGVPPTFYGETYDPDDYPA